MCLFTEMIWWRGTNYLRYSSSILMGREGSMELLECIDSNFEYNVEFSRFLALASYLNF